MHMLIYLNGRWLYSKHTCAISRNETCTNMICLLHLFYAKFLTYTLHLGWKMLGIFRASASRWRDRLRQNHNMSSVCDPTCADTAHAQLSPEYRCVRV